MIRVLHVITGLEAGGAEAMLERVATGLTSVGIESAVASLTGPGLVGPRLVGAGVPVFDLGLRRGQISLGAVGQLRRLIAEVKPQILQTWLYHADLLGLLARGFGARPRLVWNLRCSDMDLARYSRLTAWVLRLLALASPVPDLVLSNSTAGQRHHQKLGYRPRRWALIPNGFDLERFQPDDAARSRLRSELGLDDRASLVGMVARVDPMKDHGAFMAAAAELALDHPRTHFLLVGRGTEALAAAAPRALAGRLHGLGQRAFIERIYPALDVHVLSSAFGEGFPNVIGEAMACGVPCVATDVGDAASLIGDTGAVARPRDSRSLAAAIGRLLALPGDNRRQLGMAARSRIADHFSLADILGRYAGLYSDLAGPLTAPAIGGPAGGQP